MQQENFIDKIKSKGYWRLNFQPLKDINLELTNCKSIIEKSQVHLRGWYYPHLQENKDNGNFGVGQNYYESSTDWSRFKEFWRMYQSGQFINYIGLREDWVCEDIDIIEENERIKFNNSIDVIGGIIYQITEFLEFLHNLMLNSDIYDNGVSIFLSMNNTKDRELKVFGFARAGFMTSHKTIIDNIVIFDNKEFSKEELLTNYREISMDAIKLLVERFNWLNYDFNSIKGEQEKFLNGKIW